MLDIDNSFVIHPKIHNNHQGSPLFQNNHHIFLPAGTVASSLQISSGRRKTFPDFRLADVGCQELKFYHDHFMTQQIVGKYFLFSTSIWVPMFPL